MQPEQRKLFVRGLACYVCNRFYLAKGMDVSKAIGMVRYLTNYKAAA
jgi:hypothetical protein